MNNMLKFFAVFLVILVVPVLQTEEDYQPEEGSVELEDDSQQKKKRRQAINPDLPMVLIIGDSISIGYTRGVRERLADQANTLRIKGNSEGTTKALQNIDTWLAQHEWDVIHFNLGLHDLKRVTEAGTSNNSNNPRDPYQADLSTYRHNMEVIVDKLQATGADLIFATTTPFPSGVRPYRDPVDAERYNAAAIEIMHANGVAVNDLYSLVKPHLEVVQKPKNVHFLPQGSAMLADHVAAAIAEKLD